MADDNQAPQQRRGSASPAAPPDNQAPQQRRGSASPAAPPHEGFCLWFTGLSGSGKSTITTHLVKELRKRGSKLEVLDGDVVRENLSKGLGFSKEDRDTNIRRIAFVANLLSRNGVPVITAAISPYREIRDEARQMMGDRFVEAYVKASVETCEERDVKGLYAKARSGEIKEFTGVSDPYEPPENPELVLETEQQSPEQSAQQILVYLEERELIPAPIAA
ncbi:MAG: adenylylsulfate kinase [Solirubrobacterales bacterium]|jgi:adenylylsulfate kinase|nr:adenylylsulfate kinase [Solirubrobacterales bacterium]